MVGILSRQVSKRKLKYSNTIANIRNAEWCAKQKEVNWMLKREKFYLVLREDGKE